MPFRRRLSRSPRRAFSYRGRWRPGVSTLLAIVLLIPLTSMAVMAGISTKSLSDQNRAASQVQADTAVLNAVTDARAVVEDEGLLSMAVVKATGAGPGSHRSKRLVGTSYTAALRRARIRVDGNPTLLANSTLATDLKQLKTLRSNLDAGHVAYAGVVSLFNRFTADIDAIGRHRLTTLVNRLTASTGSTSLLYARVEVLPPAFAALGLTLRRVALTDTIVSGQGTPITVRTLMEANGAYGATCAALTANLGPNASTAWRSFTRDPAARRFETFMEATLQAAQSGRRSPASTDLVAYQKAFTDLPRLIGDLTRVTRAATVDVYDVARREQLAATGSYRLGIAVFLFDLLLAFGAAILLARSITRPLGRLAQSARQIRDGYFTVPSIPATGPREIAETIRIVDEMSAVLAVVEDYTVKLAEGGLTSAIGKPLPGRTGSALRTTLALLRESMLDAEAQRQALRDREERMRIIFEASVDGICGTTLDGCFTFANSSLAEWLGFESADELIGRPIVEFLAPDERARIEHEMEHVLQFGKVAHVPVTIARAAEPPRHVEVAAALMRDASGAPLGMTAVIHDVSERLAYEDQLRFQALHDAMTGLPNRLVLLDRLHQATTQGQRAGTPFCLLILDLNGFKEVNDNLGHQAGDALLQEAAQRLRAALRDSDTVARIGGDEFAVVLPDTGEKGAKDAATRITAALAAPFAIDGFCCTIDASVGIACFPSHGDDDEALLRHADDAMYVAKRARVPFALYRSEHDNRSRLNPRTTADAR